MARRRALWNQRRGRRALRAGLVHRSATGQRDHADRAARPGAFMAHELPSRWGADVLAQAEQAFHRARGAARRQPDPRQGGGAVVRRLGRPLYPSRYLARGDFSGRGYPGLPGSAGQGACPCQRRYRAGIRGLPRLSAARGQDPRSLTPCAPRRDGRHPVPHGQNHGDPDMIERIDTGTRMSKIVKHNGVAYLCGQVGAGDSVTEQTRDCLSRVEALLDKAGSSPEQMLQAVIWLADMADFAEMNAVWDAWVPEGHAPARACGEAKLARPELKVEIIVTAAC